MAKWLDKIEKNKFQIGDTGFRLMHEAVGLWRAKGVPKMEAIKKASNSCIELGEIDDRTLLQNLELLKLNIEHEQS